MPPPPPLSPSPSPSPLPPLPPPPAPPPAALARLFPPADRVSTRTSGTDAGAPRQTATTTATWLERLWGSYLALEAVAIGLSLIALAVVVCRNIGARRALVESGAGAMLDG